MAIPQDVILVFGDSTACEGSGIPAHGFSAGQVYEWFHTPGWFELSSSQQSASWFPDLGKYYFGRTGRTLGIIPGAASGSNLLSHWDPGAGSHADYDAALALVTDANPASVLACIGHLGPNSVQVSASPTPAAYTAALGRLAAGFASSLPGAPPTYINLFADKDPSAWSGGASNSDYISGMNAVRQGTLDAITAGTCRRGADLTGEYYPADHTHPASLAFGIEIGARWDLALQSISGPTISSVTIDSTKKILRVTVTSTLGSSLSSTVNGWRVFDDSTDVTANLTSTVVTTTHVITLTLSVAISGTCTVRFASGEDAINTTIPVGVTQTLSDASTVKLPLQPTFNHAVTTFTAGACASVFAGCLR